MLSKTILINGGVGVAILGVAAGAILVLTGSPASTTSSTSRTVAVSTADLSSVATASGNVSPASTTVINAQNCTGPIASVAATVGQQVSAGQQLVSLDPTNAQNALAVAQAQLDTANAQASTQTQTASNQISSANQSLLNAQQSAALDASQSAATIAADQTAVNNDATTVVAAQTAAQSNSQPAQQALASAQAQQTKDVAALTQAQSQAATSSLKDKQQEATAANALTSAQNAAPSTNTTSAQIAVDTAQKNLASCSLTAPVSGTITAVNAVVGGNAGGSSGSTQSSSGGTTGASSTSANGSASASSGLVTISDTAHLQVVASFAEADISAMKVGDAAVFTFPAIKTDSSAAPVTGTIVAIAQTATTANNVVSYPVTISIMNPPSTLRLGQSANISVTTATAKSAMVVPTLAITTTGAKETVNVLRNGNVTPTPITTGIAANGRTQVLTGLSAGDQIELPAISSSLDTAGTTTRSGAGRFGGGTGGFGGGTGGGTRGNGG